MRSKQKYIPPKKITFLLPRDDLSVRAGKQKVKVQRDVAHQVVQDGHLQAAQKPSQNTQYFIHSLLAVSSSLR